MYDPKSQPASLPLKNEQDFIQEVRPLETSRSNPWVTRLIIAGWALIVAKSVFVWWACAHYAVPFHPLWVIVPTVAFGALCTGVYLRAQR